MPDDQDELIEQELIEQDELIEAARGAFRLFAEIATMAGNRPEESDVTEIADEIEDRGLDPTDSLSYTLAWRGVRARRQEQEERRARYSHYKQEYLSPSDEARSEVIAEFREHRVPASKTPFTPEREYSAEELDQMSADEYRRKVLGEFRPVDRQDESTLTEVPERLDFKLRVLENRLDGATYAPDRLRAQLRSLKTLLRNP